MVHVLQSIHQKGKNLYQSSFFTQGKIPFMILHRVGNILSGKVKNNRWSIFSPRDIHVAPKRLIILLSPTKITNIQSSGQNPYSTTIKLYSTLINLFSLQILTNRFEKNLYPHALWLYNTMLCPNCFDVSLLGSNEEKPISDVFFLQINVQF